MKHTSIFAIALLAVAPSFAQSTGPTMPNGGYTIFQSGRNNAEIRSTNSGGENFHVFTQTQGNQTLTTITPMMGAGTRPR